MKLNIGDRVRLLHHKEEGVVTRIIDTRLVEVTIDGDFPLPVLRSELSPIAREEEAAFGTPQRPGPSRTPQATAASAPPSRPAVLAAIGLYFAFAQGTKDQWDIYLINNTDLHLLWLAGTQRADAYHHMGAGQLEPRRAAHLGSTTSQRLGQQPLYLLQLLRYLPGGPAPLPPLLLQHQPSQPLGSLQPLPVVPAQGYLAQLDQPAPEPVPASSPAPTAKTIDPQAIKEALLGGTKPAHLQPALPRAKAEVDLHLEVLCPDSPPEDPSQCLALQLSTFEKELDKAVAAGLPHITFIHGVGAGKLRQAIHRHLGKHPHVAHFQDAAREKFGYGATKATLK